MPTLPALDVTKAIQFGQLVNAGPVQALNAIDGRLPSNRHGCACGDGQWDNSGPRGPEGCRQQGCRKEGCSEEAVD